MSSYRFMKRFADARYAPKIRLPTLVIAAGADPVCATPATERFAARLKAGHAIVIPGARHEILMETDDIREQFWAAFDAFIPGTPDGTFEPSPEPSSPQRLRSSMAAAWTRRSPAATIRAALSG